MVSNGEEILFLDQNGTLYLIEPDLEKLAINH